MVCAREKSSRGKRGKQNGMVFEEAFVVFGEALVVFAEMECACSSVSVLLHDADGIRIRIRGLVGSGMDHSVCGRR